MAPYAMFARAAGNLADVVQPMAEEAAATAGVEAVGYDADGKPVMTTGPVFGRLEEIARAAARAGHMAALQGEIEKTAAEKRREYANDPARFDQFGVEFERNLGLREKDPAVRVPVRLAVRQTVARHSEALTADFQRTAMANAKASLETRLKANDDKLEAIARQGGTGTDAYRHPNCPSSRGPDHSPISPWPIPSGRSRRVGREARVRREFGPRLGALARAAAKASLRPRQVQPRLPFKWAVRTLVLIASRAPNGVGPVRAGPSARDRTPIPVGRWSETMTAILPRNGLATHGETPVDFNHIAMTEAAGSISDLGYDNLRIEIDTTNATCWCYMDPVDKPSYTHELMGDISRMQTAITRTFASLPSPAASPFSWFVMASAVPGIYNLGGDLGHFAQRIRSRDLDAMRHYGHVAVEAIHRNAVAFDSPVVTMALVQGDALGGGFEHALSFDLIIAERSAKMGLPEILFNMFPGMGAYSFLTRRMDRSRAEALILSGRVHTAEELHEMGIVDVLAEDGQGEQAAVDYIARNHRKHNAHHAVYRARRRANPITLEELIDVVDIWAEAAINLTEADLKKMDRLCAAQNRRLSGLKTGAPMLTAAE